MLLPDAAGPSTAMTRGGVKRPPPTGAIPAPRPFISAAKPGKLVSIASAPATVTGCSGEPAQDQEAHGDPMVELRVDQRRRRRPAAAMHDQVVALDLDP